MVYPALAVTVGWTLVTRAESPGAWLAAAGAAIAVGATALSAAPAHRGLSASAVDDRPALLRTLARADRVRTLGALVCLVGALLAV